MFKILCPLSEGFDIQTLIDSGADEFYFGYSASEGLNRRYEKGAHLGKDEIYNVLRFKQNNLNIKFFMTLNEASVDKKDDIDESLFKSLEFPVDAYIVREISLIMKILKIKPDAKFHISSLTQCWNTHHIKFLLNNFSGIERIVLPRDLTPSEILDIIKDFPKIEFELFGINVWCWNVDGFCSSLHDSREIGIPFICQREYRYSSIDKNITDKYLKILKNRSDCKTCSLAEYKDLENLISLKIVGRGMRFKDILADVQYFKLLLDFMNSSDNERLYHVFNQKINHRFKNQQLCAKCEYKVGE